MNWLKTFAATGLLSLGIGLSPAAQAEPITWRLTTHSPEGSQEWKDHIEPFVRNVEALTNGEIKIQAFGAGVIAPAVESARAVQQGLADVALFFPAFLVNENPANAFFAGLPGGMGSEGTLSWYYVGGGEQLLADFRRETMGLHSIISVAGPSEVFAHSHKPIRTAEDLKGIKFRTTGAWAQVLKNYFGGSPTVIPGGEIFTNLERKVIDGTEFVTPSINQAFGFHKIAKYIVFPGIHQPTYVYETMWKKETWDALRPDLQDKVKAAARMSIMEANAKLAVDDARAMENFRDGPNEIIILDPALIAQIRESTRDWATKTAEAQAAKGDGWMKKIMASYVAFQDRWVKAADIRLPDR